MSRWKLHHNGSRLACKRSSESDSLGRFLDPETMQESMKKSAFSIFVINDLPGPRDQHRAIGTIEDATGQISHDVVAERAACLRRAGHDKIVFPLVDLGKDLI